MLALNQTTCNVTPLSFDLSFDVNLYCLKPFTLGLDYKQLQQLQQYFHYDSHLAFRLEYLAYQVEYATETSSSDLEPLSWLHSGYDRDKKKGKDLPYIDPKHFEELVDKSGISPLITILNLQSFYHYNQVTAFLGYSCKSTGWVTWAVDPMTGVTDTNIATHFKPDKPYVNDKKKEVKYLCPKPDISGKRLDVIYHNVGNTEYWKDTIGKLAKVVSIVITEGSKKALCGLSYGLPTVACLGTWLGVDKLKYQDDNEGTIKTYKPKQGLKPLISSERPLYIAFDSDAIKKQSVKDALTTLAKSIIDESGIVEIPTWGYSEKTKGMDDFILKEGIEAFRKRLELAYSLEDYQTWYVKTTSDERTLKLKSLVEDYHLETDLYKKVIKEETLIKEFPTLRNPKKLDTLLHYDSSEVVEDVDSLIVSSIDFINDTSIGKLDYLIDKFAARGTVNMISASSGVGKTTLFYYMAKVAATGEGYFCTRPVLTKCKVLFIQSDEDDSTMQERTTNIGCDVEGITFIPQSKGWSYDGNGLEVLESLINKYRYDLIIIDNLDDVKPRELLSLSETNAGDIMIKPLKRMATKYNTCFYVLNHTPKNEPSNYIGSWSLAKPLQVMLHLEKDKADSSKLYLKETKSRMHKPEKFSYLRGDFDNLHDFKNITEDVEGNVTPKNKPLSQTEKLINLIKTIEGETYYENETNSTVRCSKQFTNKNLEKLGYSSATVKRVTSKLKVEGKIRQVGFTGDKGKEQVFEATDLLV